MALMRRYGIITDSANRNNFVSVKL